MAHRPGVSTPASPQVDSGVRHLVRLGLATAAVLGIAAVFARRAGERPAPPRPPTARPIRVLPPDSIIAGPVEVEHRVGDYRIRLIRDTTELDRVIDIAWRGHRVFAVRAPLAWLEQVGRDVTGDRVPDVIVRMHSGGIHCCASATVLSLGDTIRVAGTVAGGDGEIEFDDLDGDGVPEVRVQDWRFAYWRDYAFVETAAPDVILRYRDGGYQSACDLMRIEAPTAQELADRARGLSDGWVTGDPPGELYAYALDLIYGGHADLAWRFFDLAWPRTAGGKAEYLEDLRRTLTGSPCWSPPPPARPAT